ncbi:mannose-6-phosphate isomerase, class I [Pseudonocardia sp.]|uniref:mannose-6-phosphate isomerase, class I n=1 Tax=Pseudonocardia sp. TaxID=60912 RepID=UPI003D119892
MDLLENPVRPYAWGSRTVIAELLGVPSPAPHPQAELWCGAHPADPSRLVRGGRSLLEEVSADPEAALGEDGAARWHGRLPFLLKVLAADEPLSLQAHPSARQAADGFARENAAGIPVDAPERNYRDPSHKPELICALTPFQALVGFREPTATVELLRALDVDVLAPHVELLAGQPDDGGLRALFTTWITLPQSMLDVLVTAVQEGAVHLAADSGSPWQGVARSLLELSERYPGDAGVLAALLLNRVELAPGEALYLPAGVLHAYLAGAGIEIMANSDNVLRGGLTPKHVDVPELARVLDFAAPAPPVLTGHPDGPWSCYDTPAHEFRLRRYHGAADRPLPVPDGGARILLCTDGYACVHAGGAELELRRGAAMWLPASDRGVTVWPRGTSTQLFLAADGL